MPVLDGVTKRFGEAVAMSGVSVAIPLGQFVGVIGRSAAGKSTTLRTTGRQAAKREAWTPLKLSPASVWRHDPRA